MGYLEPHPFNGRHGIGDDHPLPRLEPGRDDRYLPLQECDLYEALLEPFTLIGQIDVAARERGPWNHRQWVAGASLQLNLDEHRLDERRHTSWHHAIIGLVEFDDDPHGTCAWIDEIAHAGDLSRPFDAHVTRGEANNRLEIERLELCGHGLRRKRYHLLRCRDETAHAVHRHLRVDFRAVHTVCDHQDLAQRCILFGPDIDLGNARVKRKTNLGTL